MNAKMPIITSALILQCVCGAEGANNNWIGTPAVNNDWFAGSNWASNRPPLITETVSLDPNDYANAIVISNEAQTAYAYQLSLSRMRMDIYTDLVITNLWGYGYYPVITQMGGAVTGASVVLGYYNYPASTIATYVMRGGELQVGILTVGRWSIGRFVQLGGTVQVGPSSGVTAIDGSSYTISNGTLNASGTFICGASAGATSMRQYLNLAGGCVNLETLLIGSERGNGTVTVSGGSNVVGTLRMGTWICKPVLVMRGSADARSCLVVTNGATFGDSYYKPAVTLRADIGETGVIPLTVRGNVTINTNTTFLATATNAAPGVYTVMTWGGTISGTNNLQWSDETDVEKVRYELDAVSKALKVTVRDARRGLVISVQ